jgi:hypothetical protein
MILCPNCHSVLTDVSLVDGYESVYKCFNCKNMVTEE